ncbi:MAG: hypothetical protein VX403_01140 [Planctomycetota bacterium]|nr:hypothetical protein [Planctomycetota bacterium]
MTTQAAIAFAGDRIWSTTLAQEAGEVSARAWEQQVDSSIVHPLALLVLGVSVIWMFAAPRGRAIWSILVIACFIPVAQRIAIVELDFNFLRIIGVCALLRLLLYGELRTIRIQLADRLMIALVGTVVVLSLLRGGAGEAITQAGAGLSFFTRYWAGRGLVRTSEDVRQLMIAVGVVAVPVALFMTIEQLTGRNNFSVFGGVDTYTILRAGKLRAQGAFCHPIIAGVFFACLLPVSVGIILSRARRTAVLLGGWVPIGLGMVVVVMTNSSTPIAGVLIGLLGWSVFRLRRNFGICIGALLVLGLAAHFASSRGLHGVVFNRVDFTGSSTGYHRYLLVDGMLKNVSSWALLGDSDPGYNQSFQDQTNMYVITALTGGLLALGIQVALVVAAFRSAAAGIRSSATRDGLLTCYGLGCAFMVACVSFTAVACFGQGAFTWYALLGALVSVSQSVGGTSFPADRPRTGGNPPRPGTRPGGAAARPREGGSADKGRSRGAAS